MKQSEKRWTASVESEGPEQPPWEELWEQKDLPSLWHFCERLGVPRWSIIEGYCIKEESSWFLFDCHDYTIEREVFINRILMPQ